MKQGIVPEMHTQK